MKNIVHEPDPTSNAEPVDRTTIARAKRAATMRGSDAAATAAISRIPSRRLPGNLAEKKTRNAASEKAPMIEYERV